MVQQNIIEPFNVDVIKVTIKDKPGLIDKQISEGILEKVFEALKQYARLERRIRNFKSTIDEKNSEKRLRRCFDTWHNLVTMRKTSESRKSEDKSTSNEKKIDQLVNVIAEKQKRITERKKEEENEQRSGEFNKNAKSQSKTLRNKLKNRSTSTKDSSVLTAAKLGYQAPHRLKAQKIIIEEQKAKLAEQSKIIQEMKLKEIDKETKETSKQTIDVAKQALNQCDQRTRRSIIHLMREQGCRDESVIEIPQIPSPPKFLIRMELRAEARKQRMKQTEEIRQRKRDEQKKKEEIIRKEAEEKQYQQQIQALKEAKQLRKELEKRRLKEIKKNERLEQLADQFYKKLLFRRYVLAPLTSIVEDKYERLKRAAKHYDETLLMKIFAAWRSEWIDQQNAKLKLADKLYRYNLLYYRFNEWKVMALDVKCKCELAKKFYNVKLLKKYNKAWHLYCIKIKTIMHEKETKAVNHYNRYLKIIHLNTWRQYMLIASDISEREQRRDEWRDLIKKFIPDAQKIKNA